MYYDGQMHVTYSLAPELIEHSRQNYSADLRNELYLGTYFIRTSVTHEPFTDARVRLAFSLSLDQESRFRTHSRGGQKPAGGLVPPFGDYPAAKQVRFDPKLARNCLLRQAFRTGKVCPT